MIVNHLQKNDFNLYLMHIFSLVQYYFSKSKQTQTTLKAVIFFVGLKATKKEKKIIFLVSNCTCNFSSAKRATSVKNAIAYNNLLFYVLLLLIINIDFTNFFCIIFFRFVYCKKSRSSWSDDLGVGGSSYVMCPRQKNTKCASPLVYQLVF